MIQRIKTSAITGLVIFLSAGPALCRQRQVAVDVKLGHSVLRSELKQTTYLRVRLKGFKFVNESDRSPVNLALVIDKSGSMSGQKIQKAREAALMVVDRLSSKDIVSVVVYSSGVQVLTPATRLSDKESVKAAIRKIRSGGSTGLFAGVSKGASEIRKFKDQDYVNRIILISDGIANVGPSSPAELGQLGASLVKEGIAVTTIGLGTGYNEDLMLKLAEKSDANHYFAENAVDLVRMFNKELGDVLSVVAQKVLVEIDCSEGVRPVRGMGREVEITGQKVVAYLNQLYSGMGKYILLEVEVGPKPEIKAIKVADVKVSYANMETHETDNLISSLEVEISDSESRVKESINKEVMISSVEQIATDNNEKALMLRDKGRIEEARKVLISNGKFLGSNGSKYKSKELEDLAETQRLQADGLEEKKWNRTRKQMRETQQEKKLQRSSRK